MSKFLNILSFLQIPCYLLALYYYTLPIWGEIEVLEALQNALLYTGLALSFMSLIENKKTLDPKHQKLLFTLLIAFTLLMAHSDTGLGNYLQFQGGKTSFSNKEKEIINLVVSEFNACEYCQAAHTALAKMNGFTDEQILDLRAAQVNWDAKYAALARLTLAITASKGQNVESELTEFYAQGYDRGSLVDLIIAIADKVVMNYLHNITKVPVDFPAAPKLDLALS